MCSRSSQRQSHSGRPTSERSPPIRGHSLTPSPFRCSPPASLPHSGPLPHTPPSLSCARVPPSGNRILGDPPQNVALRSAVTPLLPLPSGAHPPLPLPIRVLTPLTPSPSDVLAFLPAPIAFWATHLRT